MTDRQWSLKRLKEHCLDFQVVGVADPKEFSRNHLQKLHNIPEDKVFDGETCWVIEQDFLTHVKSEAYPSECSCVMLVWYNPVHPTQDITLTGVFLTSCLEETLPTVNSLGYSNWAATEVGLNWLIGLFQWNKDPCHGMLLLSLNYSCIIVKLLWTMGVETKNWEVAGWLNTDLVATESEPSLVCFL